MTERSVQNLFFRRRGQRYSTVMPNCTPPCWYECDLLAITKAGYMYEFEIKLTRSDYRADAKKGALPLYCRPFRQDTRTKHEQLADHDRNGPVRFWFIVPANLVSVDELPDWAGLLYLCGSPSWPSFEDVRSAPRLHNNRMSEDMKDSIRQNLYWRYWNERLQNDKTALL
jgi:hypothetical protein